jgi:hypothetical protein
MNSSYESLPNKTPSLQAITDSYQEVINFNNKHTGMSIGIMNILRATLEYEESVETSTSVFEEALEKANSEDSMHKELTQIVNEDILRSIGVSLQHGSQLKSSTGASISAPKLITTIADIDIFQGFLSKQSKTEIQSDDKNFDLIIDLVKDIKKRVLEGATPFPESTDHYMVQECRSSGELALKHYDYIHDDLKTLGLDKPDYFIELLQKEAPAYLGEEYSTYTKAKQHIETSHELEEYLEYWGRDLLIQYVRTGSPEQLQKDKIMYLDGEHMNIRLNKQTDYIIDLCNSQNDNEKDYGVTSAKNILHGINTTITLMENNQDEWYVNEENEIFLKFLRTAINLNIED